MIYGLTSRPLALLSQSPYPLAWLLFIASAVHIGNINAYFYCDDFIQYAYFHGSEQLAALGLIPQPLIQGDTLYSLFNQFNFFNKSHGTYQSLFEYGAIPWWTSEDARLHLFRPLSSLTHWLDYQLWPQSQSAMLLHNLFVYLVFIALCYRLYTPKNSNKKTAYLALLFIILDYGTYNILSWVAARNTLLAAVLGFSSLYCYQLSSKARRYLIPALILYIAALLAAEGAIAIAGYFGAYYFIYDKRPWLNKTLALSPFVLISLIWQYLYIEAGYGAQAIGQYIHPSTSPAAFATHGLSNFPLVWFELFSNIDLIELWVAKQHLPLMSKISAFLGLVYLLVLWPLRHKAEVQFCVLAVFFSIVPGLSLATTDPRTLLIPSVGASYLIASVAMTALDKSALSNMNRLQTLAIQSCMIYSVITGIVISGFLTAFFNTLYLTMGVDQRQKYEPLYDYHSTQQVDAKNLIIVNSPNPFLNLYYPFHADYLGETLPLSTRILSPALDTVHLYRVSETQYQLTNQQGLILNRDDMNDDLYELPAFHLANTGKQMLGFFRDAEYNFQEGQTFEFTELKLTIKELKQGRPSTLNIVLKPDSKPVWLYWSWPTLSYKTLPELKIGQSFMIDGPLIDKPLTKQQ